MTTKAKNEGADAKTAAANPENKIAEASAKIATESGDNNLSAAVAEVAAAEAQDTGKKGAPAAGNDPVGEEVEYDYVVVKHFRDKNNLEKMYNPGDSANRFGEERLTDLMNRKLVERRIKQ